VNLSAHTRLPAARLQGYLFVLPALVILGVFGLYPLVYAVYLSVSARREDGGGFAGAQHYADAFANDGFRNSVKVTLWYAVGTVPLTIVLSLLLGLALFRVRRVAGILRTAFFLPYVTSVVAAAMVWRELFEPSSGLVNAVFELAGLPEQTWLLEPRGVLNLITNGAIAPDVGPSLALVCVIVFEIWRSCGFMIVLVLAGLAAVPRELEEAARIDGAGAWRVVRHVTLPMLTPTLFFLSVIGTLHALQAFSDIYAMTGDGRGPLNTTQNLPVYIFTNFYEAGRIEYGSAVAVLLAAGILVLTALQFGVLGRRVHYE
jgi:ABC-type sugar transport system permease subunit